MRQQNHQRLQRADGGDLSWQEHVARADAHKRLGNQLISLHTPLAQAPWSQVTAVDVGDIDQSYIRFEATEKTSGLRFEFGIYISRQEQKLQDLEIAILSLPAKMLVRLKDGFMAWSGRLDYDARRWEEEAHQCRERAKQFKELFGVK